MVRTALISGAGVAGSAAAWQLAERGVEVTIVEKSAGQRSSGNPVDVRGDALRVVEQMGIVDRIRASATSVQRLVAVDRDGKRVATIPAAAVAGDPGSIEIPRAELSGILLDAAAQRANVVYDESIVRMHESADGVDVTFESGAEARFDIVVGTDGQHSRVRSLAFGPEARFAHRIGMFVGTVAAPDAQVDTAEMTMLSAPGVSFSLHPSTGIPIGAFIFHSDRSADYDHRDTAQHRTIVADAYAGLGWRVPEFVERFATADDVYFDAVTQIRLDAWSRGRVALLGDAASSVSLFGDGSSLAIVGARTLADALAASPTDPARAFAEYERAHRLLVMPKQKGVRAVGSQIVPKTALGLAARNAVLRGMQGWTSLRGRGRRVVASV